jgi:uncharacterized protein YyaL (SSP411 family)
LYEATLQGNHLEFAIDLAESMLSRFYDAEHGGFWQSGMESRDLILRIKEDNDGAEPSGNSVAIFALLRLAAITERADFKKAAEWSLRYFSPRLHELSDALPHMLNALLFWLQEPLRVVIAGHPDSSDVQNLIGATHQVYRPEKIILGTAGPVDSFTRTLPAHDDRPTAYICRGSFCLPPVCDSVVLRKVLADNNPSGFETPRQIS